MAIEDQTALLTGDPYFGLHMGEFIEPGNWGVLGYMMMNCRTLREAFEKSGHYSAIIGNLFIIKTPIIGDTSIIIDLWEVVIPMGRQTRYRHKRHEEVHSLKSKSLFGHLVTELRKTQGFTLREAEIVAKPCYNYFTNHLCNLAEGQIQWEIIDGLNTHKRCKKDTTEATLTLFTYATLNF